MTQETLFAHTAVELARRNAGSARPDAPVVPDVVERPARTTAARFRLADSLRAVARWVEPRRAEACQPS
jgi:hypothetical protein